MSQCLLGKSCGSNGHSDIVDSYVRNFSSHDCSDASLSNAFDQLSAIDSREATSWI